MFGIAINKISLIFQDKESEQSAQHESQSSLNPAKSTRKSKTRKPTSKSPAKERSRACVQQRRDNNEENGPSRRSNKKLKREDKIPTAKAKRGHKVSKATADEYALTVAQGGDESDGDSLEFHGIKMPTRM